MSNPLSDALAYRKAGVRKLSSDIHDRMCRELACLGFLNRDVRLRPPQEASYRLEKDPASCEYSLVGDWIDSLGYKQGTLLFHADGSFFVEQDVVQPHPKRKQWFVEAINAWGRDERIKVEARLIPMPE